MGLVSWTLLLRLEFDEGLAMNLGILPLWLLIGGCAVAANVPLDLVVLGVAAGVALSMLAATRQLAFFPPAIVALLPPLWRYLFLPIAAGDGSHGQDALLRIAQMTSTPGGFIALGAFSFIASFVLAMKWLHTGRA